MNAEEAVEELAKLGLIGPSGPASESASELVERCARACYAARYPECANDRPWHKATLSPGQWRLIAAAVLVEAGVIS